MTANTTALNEVGGDAAVKVDPESIAAIAAGRRGGAHRDDGLLTEIQYGGRHHVRLSIHSASFLCMAPLYRHADKYRRDHQTSRTVRFHAPEASGD